MKTVYLIGGTMGVGKTTVCQALKKILPRCVFLDGDWCWDAHPFQVNEETKAMVIQNICFLLNQFIHCSVYDNIVFCWVMHEQDIIDTVLAGLNDADCREISISLLCRPDTLQKRIKNDIKKGIRTDNGTIEKSIARIALYESLNTQKISTDDRSIQEIAEQIAAL